MHETILLFLALLLIVSLLVMLAQRLNISYPIFLVLGGLVISFIPGLPRIDLDPDIIFLIFLPPLLYEAAWFTSWKEFWKWRRIISMLAFGLVIITSCVVAFVSNALIPGFTLALGFLLGGIISPPDAVAATSVLKGIKVPRVVTAILEGESLINDASSLTVFRFALAAVLSGSFVFHEAATSFMMLTVMGVMIGLAVAHVFYAIHRWLPTTSSIDTALTFVAPYLMYLTAEQFHYSGVMAVVSGGLFLSFRNHEFFTHSSRLQALNAWATVSFVLNGVVFILIGLELPTIVEGLGDYSKVEAIKYGLIISAIVIVTRLLVAQLSALFTRLVSRWISVSDAKPGWRNPVIIGWAGMRGVVSLASALSIPLLAEDGTPFPQRNLILFITFVVILVTLVLQGLTLPLIIRWVNPREREGTVREEEQDATVRLKLLNVSLTYLNEHYAVETEKNELVANLKTRMESDVHLTNERLDSLEDCRRDNTIDRFREVVIDVIEVQRKELYRLGRETEFSDEVIRRHEAQLDLEEEKISKDE
ncbi:Na+/H+ antiporter [Spirosoma sp. KUDC1026]|uniref:Na+/H+ antiporter n=1 Tax=Spirosoma sp. KUDC1026 TaxID=2745947 RepID=UPI00159BC11D|nr:Na+/H+ antiporter [Spirosoma sp. KUDC1026]QKZ14817.1 Na+/H+ antiporter [Spirosoma sp. KUDC1026]